MAEADDAEPKGSDDDCANPIGLFWVTSVPIGHYYWDCFFSDQASLAGFRQTFGDESHDYAAALKQHYEDGAPADWQENFISSYATAHPWEDWAETWRTIAI